MSQLIATSQGSYPLAVRVLLERLCAERNVMDIFPQSSSAQENYMKALETSILEVHAQIPNLYGILSWYRLPKYLMLLVRLVKEYTDARAHIPSSNYDVQYVYALYLLQLGGLVKFLAAVYDESDQSHRFYGLSMDTVFDLLQKTDVPLSAQLLMKSLLVHNPIITEKAREEVLAELRKTIDAVLHVPSEKEKVSKELMSWKRQVLQQVSKRIGYWKGYRICLVRACFP